MEQTHDLPGAWFQWQRGVWWWTKAGAHLAEGLSHGPKLQPDNEAAGMQQLYNLVGCFFPSPPLSSFNLVLVSVWSLLQLAKCHCLCTTDTNRFWRVMWNYPELFKSHRPYLFSSAAHIALTGVALFMHVCCFTLAPGLCWPVVPRGNLWFHAFLSCRTTLQTIWGGICT